MINRFEGDAGRKTFVETLKEQKIVAGDLALAEAIAYLCSPEQIKAGTAIIQQDGVDNHVYLILAGRFDILVKGRKVAQRIANDHVGEMAAIQPTQRRSATVIAAEDAVVCKLAEPQFTDLAYKYPNIWRYCAKDLARRLQQRNTLVTSTHEKIRVFIISSTEALEIARGIQNAFEYDPYAVTVWTDGVFRASSYPVESLERQLDAADFAIAIVQPDDKTEVHEETWPSPRDNVIFELGLFIGRIGRQRSFLVEPRGVEVKLPSDLAGITTITYRYGDGKDLATALAPACNRMREIIKDLGPNN